MAHSSESIVICTCVFG